MDRRRFIKAATVGGVVGLAGCMGEDPTTDGGGRNVVSTVVGGELGGNLYGSDNLIIETVTANTLLYNSLVTRDPKTAELAPDAAKEMPTIENNGKTFTFDLKKGVTFTDGTELIADDVKYSFEVLNEYDLTHKDLLYQPLESIEVEDDYRITFTHSQPNAPWTGFLSIYFSLIQEGIADEIDKFPADLNNGPPKGANSGPFTLEEYRPQSIARFVARDNYHEDGVPAADEIQIDVIPEPSSQRIALTQGDVDILGDVTPKDYEPMLQEDGINGNHVTNPLSRMTIYMSHKPPFDNVHNRKAVSYAVDRKSIIDNVHYGRGHTSSVPAPPDSWFYNEEADIYGAETMPKKAQQQLDQAGNPDGFSFQMNVSSQSPVPDTATALQQNLADVGIEMKINQVSPGSFYGPIANQDYVAGLEYWNSVIYPGYYIFQLFAEFGGYWGWHKWGKYGDTKEPAKRMTEVMRKARESPDREHRAPYLKEAQQIFSDEMIFVLIGGVNVSQLWRERVENYHILPTVWNNLREVGIK